MIDLVTMKKVWSFRINNKGLYNDSKIVRILSALGPKKLDLKTFNKMIY